MHDAEDTQREAPTKITTKAEVKTLSQASLLSMLKSFSLSPFFNL